MVGEAIQSVLDQTFADFELIVVDDGSTDNTQDRVRNFVDARIKYIYQENAGLAAARNTGIDQAKGVYVAFLDDDDIYLPDKLGAHVRFMQEDTSIGWTAGGTLLSVDSVTPVAERLPWRGNASLDVRTWLSECLIPPHAALVKRCWMTRVNGFDEKLRQAEDWDLWLRLAYAGCPMAWIRQPVCVYRLHKSSMTGNAAAHKRYLLLMLDKFFQQPDLPADLRSLEQITYAKMRLQGAVREYRVAQIEEAVEDVAQAFRIPSTTDLTELQEFFLQLIVAWAGHPLTTDPNEYIDRVFDNLPANVAYLRTRRRETLARFSMSHFFRASENQDWPEVRRMFTRSITNDPSWLANRGVWSIMGSAVFGPQSMNRLSSVTKALHAQAHATKAGDER